MDCWDRFEFKAAAMFTGHPRRTASVRKELARVGLAVQEFWGHPNVFDIFIQANVRVTRSTAQPGFFNATMTHYHIIKTAYELGAGSLLCVENDVRFLNDLGRLDSVVRGLPENFDYALFSWEVPLAGWAEACKAQMARPRAAGWAQFDDLRGFACYAMSRKGMKDWLRCVERTAHDPSSKFLICDMYVKPGYMDPGLVKLCAVPPAAVQGTVDSEGGEAGLSPSSSKWQRYSCCGIKREDYAP